MDILVAKDGRPSMKGVYAQMNGGRLLVRRQPRRGGEIYRVYTGNNSERFAADRNPQFDNIVLRWGNYIRLPEQAGRIVYNNATAIKRATNKKTCRQFLLSRNIRCPRLVDRTNTVFPVIARPSRHAKGRNFVVLRNRAEFVRHYDANESQGWYYSEFIDKSHEYRVHCAHGKVIEVMEKPRGEGIAWNRARVGEPFIRVPREQYDSIPHLRAVCLEALKAVKEVGLDFSGVDVIVFNNQAYVVECNTSQTLNSSPHVTERYARYFSWLNRSNARRPHWDFTGFDRASSLVWKNQQLNSNDNPARIDNNRNQEQE